MFHQYLNQPRQHLTLGFSEGTVNKASVIVRDLHVRFKKMWLFITVAGIWSLPFVRNYGYGDTSWSAVWMSRHSLFWSLTNVVELIWSVTWPGWETYMAVRCRSVNSLLVSCSSSIASFILWTSCSNLSTFERDDDYNHLFLPIGLLIASCAIMCSFDRE